MTKQRGLIRVKLENVQPNPFRRTDRYPIRKEKVAALRESIGKTGFWDNIVARRSPSDSSKVEIAYGHHRIVALNEEFSPGHEIGLILRELDDETMLNMMIRENGEEYGADALALMETIEATVLAYADFKVNFPPVHPKATPSDIRYAPGFAKDPARGTGHRPYTVRTLAEFLNWQKGNGEPQEKLFAVVNALAYIEEDFASRSDFEGLNIKQLREKAASIGKEVRPQVAAKLHRAQAEVSERKVAEAVSPREAQRYQRQAETAYKKAEELENPPPKALPDINDYAPTLAARLSGILEESTDPRASELNRLLENLEHLEPTIRDDLERTLLMIARRATNFAEAFQRPAMTQERRLQLVSTKGN